jgi:hypothetical protein
MSNSGKWNPVTFDELQAGDRVQVKLESSQDLGPWLRRTVDQGEFVLGELMPDGWSGESRTTLAVRAPSDVRAGVKQTILRYTPPFEFPTKLGTVFSGLHFEEGRHTFVVADRLSDTDKNIYMHVDYSSWFTRDILLSSYSDFKLGEA